MTKGLTAMKGSGNTVWRSIMTLAGALVLAALSLVEVRAQGGASQLAFKVQPSTTAVGATVSPAVTVEVQDSNGNVVTTSAASITVALANNPSSATLGGTLS